MIWKRNGGNITFISKRGKPMYEKDGSSQILVQNLSLINDKNHLIVSRTPFYV